MGFVYYNYLDDGIAIEINSQCTFLKEKKEQDQERVRNPGETFLYPENFRFFSRSHVQQHSSFTVLGLVKRFSWH